METMKSITIKFLNDKKTMSFDKIWKEVSSKLMPRWEEKYPKSKVEKSKIGELYSMLTRDGEFIKNSKDEWTLIKFYSNEEVKKMRINVGELGD